MNSSVRQPPSSGTLFNSLRHSTNLKRKRNQSELSNNSAKSSTNPSWFGLAFQLPSVIKREFTDFVKTVRGGYSQAMEGNFVDQTDHHPLDPPQHLPSTFPRRTRDHHSKKTTRTKKASNQQSQPKSHSTLPAHHHQYQPMQLDSDDLNEETDTDQPSPPKKLRLSNSTNLIQLKSASSPRSPILSISSGPGSPRPFSLKPQYSSAHAMSRNSCLPGDKEMEGEEVTSPRMAGAARRFGSNSVLFPDSNLISMEGMDQDPPGIAVSKSSSMDITRVETQDKDGKYLNRHSVDDHRYKPEDQPGAPSVLRTLMEQSASGSEDSPFSSADHSLFSRGQFSTQTSLTSTTSTVMTNQADQSHCSNVAPSRPRHTKLLGAPRSLNRPYSLSASSISSLNSFAPVDSARSHPHIPHGVTTDPGHHLIRSSTTSLHHSSHPHVSWQVPEDECEQLTNELTSSIHNRLHFHSPHLEHRLTTAMSQQYIRPKVPLDEVIGKPSLPNLRQPMTLAQSSSQISLNHAEMRSHLAMRDLASHSAAHTTQQTTLATDRPLSRTDNESTTDSTTTTIHTTSRNPLADHHPGIESRQRSSNPTVGQGNRFTSPAHRSEPPQQNHQTIEEVDEDADEISYELLERPNCDASPPPNWEKKRKRGLIYNYRELRKSFSTTEQSLTKSTATSPGHPKPNQKLKVMTKLGLIRPTQADSDAMEQDTTDDDTLTEEQSVTPTKKIKFLEDEVQRLRRELESEKLRHSQELHRSMKLNSSLLNRSKKGYTSQASNSSSRHDVSRVRFSPQSAWSSSPASAPRFGRFRSSARAQATPNTLTGTPVVVKKPSEGAMIGGSPFVVSRVYGEGPEVIGEKTPEAVHRRSLKLKALSVSQTAVRLPGLAQDLFGAGLSSESGNTTARNGNPFQASGLPDPSRWKGKGKQIDQGPPLSAKSTGSGWVRDSELEKDLFGEPSTQQLRRHSFAPLSGSNSGRLASSSTNSLNTTVKPKHAYRNSIGGPYALASSGAQDERPPADMTSFLNELKSAGKDKLRKTVGSLKYYNPHNHFGSVKVSVLTREQMPLPRSMDPKNTEIMNMMLEQDFGKSTQGSLKRSEANDLERSSSQLDRSTSLEKSSGVSKDVVVEPLKSPLSRKIYPSSTSFGITAQTGELGVSSSTHAGNQTSCDLESTARTDPRSVLGLGIEDELSKQDRSSKQLPASDRLRMVSESTPAVNEHRPRTPQRSASEAMLTRSTQASGSITRSTSKHTRLLRSTQASASNTSGPLSAIDPNRAKVAEPVSILSTSFKPITDESGSLRSSSASSNATRRVRIVEDAAVLTRRASQRSTSKPGITDENLVAVVEEEGEEVVSDVGIGGVTSAGTVIGFGVGVGEAISTSGKEWVVVKSDSDRLGEGEENLRRWSLKPSAILRAHPKIVYPDEN